MPSESLYTNCRNCGKAVAKNATSCSACGAKLKKLSAVHWVGIAVAALVVIGIANTPAQDPSKASSSSSTGAGPANPVAGTASMPSAEQQFISMLALYSDRYTTLKNELQQSALRDERKQSLAQSLGNRRVDGWRGVIAQLETNTDGKAILSIKLSPRVEVKTWNNALSDLDSNTLIEKTDPIYRSIFNLGVGDEVTFSGSFMASDVDYIKEASLTIDGSMTRPEFIVKFASVTPAN